MSSATPCLEEGQVCVIGRCNFHTGIGLHTFAFAELLSRHFATCIQPTETHLQACAEIALPSGRAVPVWRGSNVKVAVFTDVLWNGARDTNLNLVPDCALRLACLVWDSDVLPDEMVDIANSRFDAIICLSPHLQSVAVANGITKPCITLPLPLYLEPLLSRPYRKPDPGNIRIGSVAAFHPRKNVQMLVEAFLDLYHNSNEVELLIHSNLSFSDEIDRLKSKLQRYNVKNVILSLEDLSNDQKISLIETFDGFVNLSRAEGYSVGPREAMALGKPCLLSAVGGHNSLIGAPGIFGVDAPIRMPARYPEVDNRVFGTNASATHEDAVLGLQRLVSFLQESPEQGVFERRNRAADFSFNRLSTAVGALVSPEIFAYRPNKASPLDVDVPKPYLSTAKSALKHAGGLQGLHGRVVQMHDGGFYSIFNSFFSHLVWDMRDDWIHRTLPDWDVTRFLNRQGSNPVESFCYGQSSDGNIWTKLFKPLFDSTEEELNTEDYIYRDAATPVHTFNEIREPLLTYVHAARLYQAPWFQNMRKEYNKVYQTHIHLRDNLATEIENFENKHFKGYKVLGAHVRHPSHTVEQPNAVIAHADDYIARLRHLAECKGYRNSSDTWRIFLATDQERVIERFRHAFGDRLVQPPAARRTTDLEDRLFDALKPEEKNVNGYQLQHLVARNQASWSLSMAEEIIRDAHLMAKCDSLLHVVSNVSTAVSYINPDCEMIYCAEK